MADNSKLTAGEISRYSRQISLSEIGIEGQNKLRESSALVVGAGGLGCPALMYLCTCGIGKLRIIDGDSVSSDNLHRQVLYDSHDLGKPKAFVARQRLQKLNPYVYVESYPEYLTVENVRRVMSDVDVVIDGSDNFETRYLINDACVEMGKPFVSASLLNFQIQISVFNHRYLDGRLGPTYRCLFPDAPHAEDVPNCADGGILGVLPGIAGAIQAEECLKIILKIGDPLVGRLLLIDSLKMTFEQVAFSRCDEIVRNTKIQELSHYRGLCRNRSCEREFALISHSEIDNFFKANRESILIDVREPHEHQQFNIGGLHIPLSDIPEWINSGFRNQPIVFYCRSGQRSARACRLILEKFPSAQVFSLKDGLNGIESIPHLAANQ